MTVPAQPKIYHIVHVDRLPSIVADGCLWCDAEIVRRAPKGTTIGMNSINPHYSPGARGGLLANRLVPTA